MKKTSCALAFILIMTIGYSQTSENLEGDKFKKHKGFYLSMSAGPNIARISDEVVGDFNFEFSGVGFVFDFKIGGVVKENIILHASWVTTYMSGPKIKSDGESVKTNNSLTIGEGMLGGGLTYYFMPVNLFLSGTLGFGNFTIVDADNDYSVSSDRGFSMQLKIGKEWWVSKRWGLGVSLTYGKTKLSNEPGGGVEELLNSNNFGILFNATLN